MKTERINDRLFVFLFLETIFDKYRLFKSGNRKDTLLGFFYLKKKLKKNENQ